MSRKAGSRCPLCGKPTATRFRPFCSGRCADVDLGRWFTGAYRIAGDNTDGGDEATPEGPDDGAP